MYLGMYQCLHTKNGLHLWDNKYVIKLPYTTIAIIISLFGG